MRKVSEKREKSGSCARVATDSRILPSLLLQPRVSTMKSPLLLLLHSLLLATLSQVSVEAQTFPSRWPMEMTLGKYFCDRNHGRPNSKSLVCLGFEFEGQVSIYNKGLSSSCFNYQFLDRNEREKMVHPTSRVSPHVTTPTNGTMHGKDPHYDERKKLCDSVVVLNEDSIYILMNLQMHYGRIGDGVKERDFRLSLSNGKLDQMVPEKGTFGDQDFEIHVSAGRDSEVLIDKDRVSNSPFSESTSLMDSNPDILYRSDLNCYEFDQGCYSFHSFAFTGMQLDFATAGGRRVTLNLAHPNKVTVGAISRTVYPDPDNEMALGSVICFSFKSKEFPYQEFSGVQPRAEDSKPCNYGDGGKGPSGSASQNTTIIKEGEPWAWWVWAIIILLLLIIIGLIIYLIIRRQQRKARKRRAKEAAAAKASAAGGQKQPTSTLRSNLPSNQVSNDFDKRSVMSSPASAGASKFPSSRLASRPLKA